jgi:DNA repair exonuclease SbcCD ATPase subunit
MVTERVDRAAQNFHHMSQLVERYIRLCKAYTELAGHFNQLDVQHMQLKEKVVLALKALEKSQNHLKVLKEERKALQYVQNQREEEHRQQVQALTQAYEEKIKSLTDQMNHLKPLESLISGEAYESLTEAENQAELIETTFSEMEEDSSPDLSEDDKALLDYYLTTPSEFLVEQWSRTQRN